MYFVDKVIIIDILNITKKFIKDNNIDYIVH